MKTSFSLESFRFDFLRLCVVCQTVSHNYCYFINDSLLEITSKSKRLSCFLFSCISIVQNNYNDWNGRRHIEEPVFFSTLLLFYNKNGKSSVWRLAARFRTKLLVINLTLNSLANVWNINMIYAAKKFQGNVWR